MYIRNFENIEKVVLNFISGKSHSVEDTLAFIEKQGYTKTEAEEILKRIYIRNGPPADVLIN